MSSADVKRKGNLQPDQMTITYLRRQLNWTLTLDGTSVVERRNTAGKTQVDGGLERLRKGDKSWDDSIKKKVLPRVLHGVFSENWAKKGLARAIGGGRVWNSFSGRRDKRFEEGPHEERQDSLSAPRRTKAFGWGGSGGIRGKPNFLYHKQKRKITPFRPVEKG